MYWLPFALSTALALSFADALSKKALASNDDIVVAWVREGYALPFLALGFFFFPLPALDAVFWITVAALLPMEITALILYVRAIKLSPLSLTAFVFLGESPSVAGAGGIVLIAVGAYALNAGAYRHGLLGPVRAIFKERGSVLMIIVALIYSLTSTLGKVAVEHSSPVFFGFFYSFLLTLAMTAYVAYKGKLRLVLSRPATFIPIGLCTATMISTHFIAISLTQAAYMISVKRTSLVWSVILGRLLFKEKDLRQRLAGSVIMMAGVLVIVLF